MSYQVVFFTILGLFFLGTAAVLIANSGGGICLGMFFFIITMAFLGFILAKAKQGVIVTAAIKRIFDEAIRRNKLFSHQLQENLHERWLGLGTEAEYRPVIKAGLMKFFNGNPPPPRCCGWLVLTDKGIAALFDYMTVGKTP